MEADALGLDAMARVLLRGRIRARQIETRAGESKYLVEGRGPGGARATVVAKLGPTVVAQLGPTGRLVITTLYRSLSEDES